MWIASRFNFFFFSYRTSRKNVLVSQGMLIVKSKLVKVWTVVNPLAIGELVRCFVPPPKDYITFVRGSIGGSFKNLVKQLL